MEEMTIFSRRKRSLKRKRPRKEERKRKRRKVMTAHQMAKGKRRNNQESSVRMRKLGKRRI